MNELFTYYKDEDVQIRFQNLEGYIFMHLDVYKWSPSVLKKLRKGFMDLKHQFQEENVDLVFASGNNAHSIKLWGLIHPLNDVQEVPENPGIYVGSWDMET